MKYIIAIDSFKGCLTSHEAAEAVRQGILTSRLGKEEKVLDDEIVCIPVSDGGEGMLDAFISAMKLNGFQSAITEKESIVHDPMMRRTNAHYAITNDGTAIIETAQACGLTLLAPEERNPVRATTYGVGELIAAALKHDCRHLIVGLGGSATSDCGIGMLRALIDIFAPNKQFDDVRALFPDLRVTIVCDVNNPLCGANGAAHVFAPQKGATPDMVEMLELRAERFAAMSAKHHGRDCSCLEGAGAAGGLGYAFLQYFEAAMASGADEILKLVKFNHLLENASLVITGEGSADRQTLMGKLPFIVLQHSQRHHVPVLLLAGKVSDNRQLLDAGFSQVLCINPEDMPHEEAIRPDVAKENLKRTINSWIENSWKWDKST